MIIDYCPEADIALFCEKMKILYVMFIEINEKKIVPSSVAIFGKLSSTLIALLMSTKYIYSNHKIELTIKHIKIRF